MEKWKRILAKMNEKSPVTGENVDDISQIVYFKSCTLYKVTPSAYCYRHLTTIELPLQNHAIGPLGAKAIATALVPNGTVKKLDLSGTGIGTDGLRYILEMLDENSVITDINLSYNDFKSEGARLTAEGFKYNQQIESLNISGNGFSDDDSVVVAELIEENTCLKHLALSRNDFADTAGWVFGRALGNNTTLTSFDVSWNHLRHRGAVEFCFGFQSNTEIQSLNLSWNGFGMEGCHEMGKALTVNKSLTELDLSSNRVCFDAFRLLLQGLVQNTTVRILKIGINPITTDGAIAILRAVADERCSSLQYLDLSDVSVDMDFLTLLEEIQEERPLIVKYGITLRHDELRKGDKPVVLDTDDPVTILFEFMKTKNLRLIDLLHNLDKDHSDTLTRDEFRRGMEEIDIPLSQRSLDILMQRLDINKDGHVDFRELLTRYKEHVRRLAKLRKEADTDLKHYKHFDRLEQLREAVRLRLAMSSSPSPSSVATQTNSNQP